MSVLIDARMAVVFDLDGTLMDTRADTTRAVNRALSSHGLPTVPEVRASDLDETPEVLLKNCVSTLSVVRPLESELVAKLVSSYVEGYGAHPADSTLWLPGALEMLEKVTVQTVLVTNKPFVVARALLEAMSATRRFTQVIAGQEYPWDKPHPMLFGAISDLVRITSHHLVVVGDSPCDIAWGKTEGAYTVGFLGGYWEPAAVREAAPDAVIEELTELPDVLEARAADLVRLEGWRRAR